MSGRSTAVALALACGLLLGSCTPDRHTTPTPTTPRSTAATTTPTPPSDQPTTVVVKGVAPRFETERGRDTAFVAQLAGLAWTSPAAGPSHPTRFRRAALGYAARICGERTGEGTAGVAAPTDVALGHRDRAELVRLSVLFYCPQLAASATGPSDATTQRATCPTPDDIVVTSVLTSGAIMSENEFYSTVSYVVAYMNLTDYPVWVTPQIRWKSMPIYKGGYPTGDLNRPLGWRPFTDPHETPTTSVRRLAAGEVWRVDALQSGPYLWTAVSARIDPTAFVAQGCGYDAR